MISASATVENPTETIARLRAENDRLRTALVESGVVAPRKWKLTAFEDKLFGALLKSKVVSKDTMMSVLYRDEDERPNPKLLDVFIHRIRKKTREHGVNIQTILGIGYALTDREVWLKTFEVIANQSQH